VEWTKSDVPVAKRVSAWGASLVLGGAMYVVFGVLLTVGLKREKEDVRGKIDSILAATLAKPKKVAKEELAFVQTMFRATSSYLWNLHYRNEMLRHEIRSKRAWAAVIGLIACMGCLALCIVSSVGCGGRRKDALQGMGAAAA
jgi:hypothetical protein